MGPHSMDFSEGVQAFGLMLLWPLLFGWAKESRGWSRIWYWGLTAAAMGAIFLLFERAIFLIMVVGLFLLVANDRKTIFLGVVVLIIIALWYIPSETIHSYLAWYRFVDFEADSPRTLIHELAMDALSRNFWFGVGPGNARNVLFGVVPYFGAHNTTLTVALEAGIIGAVLITLLHVYIVYLAIKVWFRGGMGPYYAVSLLSIPACSFVYDWHHAPEVTFMFCIILVQARHMMKASFERSPGRVYWYNNRYLMVPEHPGP